MLENPLTGEPPVGWRWRSLAASPPPYPRGLICSQQLIGTRVIPAIKSSGCAHVRQRHRYSNCSSLAATTVRPSGAKPTVRICPFTCRESNCSPPICQRRTEPSSLAVAKISPSRLNARCVTGRRWPPSTASTRPSGDQRRAVRSSLAVAIQRPSRLNVAYRTSRYSDPPSLTLLSHRDTTPRLGRMSLGER